MSDTFAQRLQRAWLARGATAIALLPLSFVYGLVTGFRRWLQAAGMLRTVWLPVPVIVVGNLIAGGAGKTPTVLAIVALLRRRGYMPGIVSRGYGRTSDAVVGVLPQSAVAEAGDEPLLMRLRSEVPVWVGRDRVAAGQALLRRHPEVDIIVSDDGLQHLRLGRDVQVLVFDDRGVGNGWLLPSGPLRERLPATLPARTLILYNVDARTTPLPGSIVRRSLQGVVELSRWRAGQPASLQDLVGLRGRRVVAAAGLGHPERFFAMLRASGITVSPLPLPDHFDFAALPWPKGTAEVIVTEKDAVKLEPARLGSTQVWVAALDFAPAPAFATALLALLAPPRNDCAAHRTTPGPAHGNPTP